MYRMSGGLVDVGPSAADRERLQLESRAKAHVKSCRRLAVMSLEGGVGKTTTTVALGATLAELRSDRVIAVDANSDGGNLGQRVTRRPTATTRNLLQARPAIRGYSDMRKFTTQAASGLEILAPPSGSFPFSAEHYREIVATLEPFYSIVLTDCETGFLQTSTLGILHLASSLVIVTSPSLDGARSAGAALDWLEANGFGELAADAVVVITSVHAADGTVAVGLLHNYFATRCRDVVLVPHDPHLESGGVVELKALRPATRHAYLKLAAAVGTGLSIS